MPSPCRLLRLAEEGTAIQIGRVAVDNHHSDPGKTSLKNRSPPVQSQYREFHVVPDQVEQWRLNVLGQAEQWNGLTVTNF